MTREIAVPNGAWLEPTDAPACPVCGSESRHSRGLPGWGEWRECQSCTLEFVHPFHITESPETLYEDAYRGKRRESAMREFHDRLAARRVLVHHDPTLWFWTPAFEATISWLRGRVPAGATVFEIGCGLGWVLHTLRRDGFEAIGLDVAKVAVGLNRDDGFRVWHGTVETVPEGWAEPDAIVAFFMLHHLADPLGFLRTLHERWPRAPLSIAQYGPSNRDPVASTPPRTLTLWNAKALSTALRLADYEPTVREFQGTGNEWRPMRPLRKLVKRTIVFPPLYRVNRRFERHVMSKLLRPVRKDAYVVHALAEPREQ